MIRFIIRVLIVAAAVIGVAKFSGGMLLRVDGWMWAAVFAIVLAFVNGVIKPVVKFIAFPFTLLTLGILSLFINLGMFYLAAAVVPGVDTVGFWPTVGASIVIAFFAALADWMTARDEQRS
jgi:putative membrane protein